jgi:hypothetical protein
MSADRSLSNVPDFVVPDLDLPTPRAPRPPAPVEARAQAQSVYDASPFEREIDFEFAISKAPPPPESVAPAVVPVAMMLPMPEAPPLEPMWVASSSRVPRVFRVLEPLAVIPRGVWKRVAAYGFLLMILGNACCCVRLGIASTIALGVVVLVALAGVAATAQRG